MAVIGTLPGQEKEDVSWSDVGKGISTGFTKLGEGIDFIDDQINLKNISGSPELVDKLTDAIPGQWDDKFFNYSYKDLRKHTAGGVGNVAGFVAKQIPGVSDEQAERINDIAEFGADILLPNAVDFLGGLGYVSDFNKVQKRISILDLQRGIGNFKSSTINNINKTIQENPLVYSTKFLNDLARGKSPITAGIAMDVSGSTVRTRSDASKVFGGQNTQAKIWYEQLQNKFKKAGKKISMTSTHHMNLLKQQAKAIVSHPNGDAILRTLREKGIPMGDDIKNYTSILDLNPKALGVQKVEELYKLHPNIPKRTLSDLLGRSEFSKQPLLKPDELSDRNLWQIIKERTGLTNPYGEFKPGSKQGPFPEIKLFDKNNNLVRTWTAKTQEQWEKRFKVINKHYGSNLKVSEVSNIKVDPELATYAPDHDFLHNEILNRLPSHKLLNKLTKSGKWESLPESKAIELLERVATDSIQASHRVSNFRYNKIAEYYNKFKLDSKLPDKFKKMEWNKLPTNIQRQYFRENASKLSSYGSRDISTAIEYSSKLTNKQKAFFGIQ